MPLPPWLVSESLFESLELSVRRYDFSRFLAVFGLQRPRLTIEVVTTGIFQMRSEETGVSQ